MPTIKMTDKTVQNLGAAPGKRTEFFDAATGGLCLRVSGGSDARDGKRVWYLLYRNGAKLVRLKLGPYPALSLADARKKANETALQRQAGIDPRAAQARAKHDAAREPDTVAVTVERYLASLAARTKHGKPAAPEYLANTRRNFENHVLPSWGQLQIQDITTRDITDLIDKLAARKLPGGTGKRQTGGGIAANRTLVGIKALFKFARQKGIIRESPADVVVKPTSERADDRVLEAFEIAAVWNAAGTLGYPFGTFYRLALLTGQRRDEIARMRWADIDLSPARTETAAGDRAGDTIALHRGSVWIIPASETKAGRAHAVPLSRQAIRELETIQAANRITATGELERSPWVFTTSGTAPISGYSKAKARLDDIITAAREGKALAPWSTHDLRRTFATKAPELFGTSDSTIARVLNHAAQGVTGRHYNHYDRLLEKRHALDLWGQYLESLIAPPASNVVTLRSRHDAGT